VNNIKELRFDFVIIGAGVVGCAIARELSLKNPNKKIAVLEKLTSVGLETSSRNSGVLHSGIHQNPNFLKSRLAQEGSHLAAEYAKSKNLPILDSGMLVVISFNAIKQGLYREFVSLLDLFKNSRKQKIKLKLLTSRGVRKLAPNIRALGGIFIPDVWVVDSLQFTQTLQKDAEAGGVQFYFKEPVNNINSSGEVYDIVTNNYLIKSPTVINAAGLYADKIANMAGFDRYKIYPWRGEYYEVITEKKNLVKRLVYPATRKDAPSKGIHFSPRVDGRLFIGPNAVSVPRKDYYTENKTPVEVFVKHIQKYVPEITARDLRWAYSGIRPKTTPGAEESDFIINVDSKKPLFVNLIGIESPGLASSIALAKHVVGKLYAL